MCFPSGLALFLGFAYYTSFFFSALNSELALLLAAVFIVLACSVSVAPRFPSALQLQLRLAYLDVNYQFQFQFQQQAKWLWQTLAFGFFAF